MYDNPIGKTDAHYFEFAFPLFIQNQREDFQQRKILE